MQNHQHPLPTSNRIHWPIDLKQPSNPSSNASSGKLRSTCFRSAPRGMPKRPSSCWDTVTYKQSRRKVRFNASIKPRQCKRCQCKPLICGHRRGISKIAQIDPNIPFMHNRIFTTFKHVCHRHIFKLYLLCLLEGNHCATSFSISKLI